MNEKLLNLYWCAIIGLLFGDGIVGIIWVMKYNSIVTNLRFDLKVKLNEEYFSNTKFQVSYMLITCDHTFTLVKKKKKKKKFSRTVNETSEIINLNFKLTQIVTQLHLGKKLENIITECC